MEAMPTFGGGTPCALIITPTVLSKFDAHAAPSGAASTDIAASRLADAVPSRLVVPDHSMRRRIYAPGVGICPPWHL